MAPSVPNPSAVALPPVEIKPDRLLRFNIPLDQGNIFLIRLDGEAELLVPAEAPIGFRYRVFAVPATLYNQRLSLGPGSVIPEGRPSRIDIFGSCFARLDFEIVGINKQNGRPYAVVSGISERWPRGAFEFAT
jgi:hypothetical protein